MEWLNNLMGNWEVLSGLIVVIVALIPMLRKAYKENKDVYEKSVPIAKKVKLYLADKKLDEVERKDLSKDLLDWANEVEEAITINKKIWNKIKGIFNKLKK